MQKLIAILHQHGLDIDNVILDGVSFNRCKCQGKKQKNGWVVGYISDRGNIFASYGRWDEGWNKSYPEENYTQLTATEIQWLKDEQELRRREQERIWYEMQLYCESYCSKLEPATTHAYFDKKAIAPSGVLVDFDKLVIPARDSTGNITTYQTIDRIGNKLFVPAAKKQGSYYTIHGNDKTICICEGFATGASIHEATGYTVIIAFDAGNMAVVARTIKFVYNNARIIVCADNDHKKKTNVGLETGQKISAELGVELRYPVAIDGTDFNDMANETSLEDVSASIESQRNYKIFVDDTVEIEIARPDGIIGELADYYNDTSGKPQPLFAIHASIAVCSVLLGRRYCTDYNNFTSLFMFFIAESGTGKEHVIRFIKKVLEESGNANVEASTWYTGETALVNELSESPRGIMISDEVGRKMAEASDGSSLAIGLLTTMMECFSSADGSVSGKRFSGSESKTIHNPALTVAGMTTPGRFNKSISIDMSEDGFLNRWLYCISKQSRCRGELKQSSPVPESILEWIEEYAPPTIVEIASVQMTTKDFKVIPFGNGCMDMLNEFEDRNIEQANALQAIQLQDMPGRKREIAMRVSLIIALGKREKVISLDSVRWSIDYVDKMMNCAISEMKRNVSSSEFEGHKMAWLDAIRKSSDGVPLADLGKRKPYSSLRPREREEVKQDLLDSGLVVIESRKSGGKGRPKNVLIAIDKF